MSPLADNTERELRSLRTAIEVSGGRVMLLADGVSWIRDNFDSRLRELEAERYERERAAAVAKMIAAARKPPVLPWRLFFCSLASAVLAIAGFVLLSKGTL